MAAACTICSAKLRAGARFCWRCGESISPPASGATAATRGPAGRQPATGHAGIQAGAPSPPATAPEEAIIGGIAPLGPPGERTAPPTSARKDTSIIAASSALRPGSAAIFSPDPGEPRTRSDGRVQDPLPWLKFEEGPPAAEAIGETAQEQADEDAPADPQPAATVEHRWPADAVGAASAEPSRADSPPATLECLWPAAPAGAVAAEPALRAGRGATGLRLSWKAAAIVVLAVLGGWYWYARSAAPADPTAEASTQAAGAALATLTPASAGTGVPAVEPTQPPGRPSADSPASDPAWATGDASSKPSDHPGAEKPEPQPQRAVRAASRKRAANTPAPVVAPPPVEEVAVIPVAPPQPAPAPPPPAPAPGPCDGLAGLRQQQCLACGTLGPFRRFDCELRVKDTYCQGKWGSSPGCTREVAAEQVGGS